jgi:AAA15 family ATPase/GTPase
MKYKDLSIANFRSINELKLDNFRQVNLITGRNNSGKTSVLEALFLLSGMSNPQLAVSINNFRNLILTKNEDFGFIFHDLDFSTEPIINGLLDMSRRSLRIKPRYSRIPSEKPVPGQKQENSTTNSAIISTSVQQSIEGVTLEFKESDRKEARIAELSLQDGIPILDRSYKEKLHCTYLNPHLAIVALGLNFENLIVNKEMESLITILKDIEPNIVDIRMGIGNMLYADIGISKMIPLNIMGDGIIRILSMIAIATTMKGGVVLIDEIENGLHYSSLEILWKALFRVAKLNDVQIFATTHSYECISALASLMDENADISDQVNLYRIDRKKDVHKGYEYSAEMIRAGIIEKIEVR